MGPERVLPSSEDELGEDERPVDGALPVGAVWSGGEGAAEEEVEEEGGEMELDGDEEEEEVNTGGYYYQPLNQDPDSIISTEQPEDEDEEMGEERGEAGSHAEQVQQVQHRIEVSSATLLRLRGEVKYIRVHQVLISFSNKKIVFPLFCPPRCEGFNAALSTR